ncbi:MAG TPA: pre-peptidase C-terminal domain-containing protein [Kofleriaceae bacterium]|jgi:hypothetical protein|nr:pre-peptidase C-terminal domain-containing protein [Kofleriaceae bacterium]
MLELLTGYQGRWTLMCVTCLATTVACGPGSPPVLSGLTDQVAQVGTVLMVNLHGTDPDGDHLAYKFQASDLTDLDGHADITVSPSGSGVFKWTPTTDDIGSHAFDFTVSDGTHDASVMIQIDVRSAIGTASAPVFRQPLGSGTTLDLTQQACVDVDVVIDDADTSTVRITQVDPVIDGATLTLQDGHTATWHWCPTKAQQAQPRYMLALAASDGDNPQVTKNYLVVLRGNSGTSCPGAPPAISHTPHDVSSIVDLAIDATITDDIGIKDAPLFYYALTAPATPPDLSKMTQLTMKPVSGDRTNGVYEATVPNPVAQMPAGTKQTVYYVLVATDNDDPTGTCNHTTTSSVYSMAVTSTGTANLPICSPCTSDTQCGTGDECVRMGSSGATFCLQACGAGCPAGYTCSATPVPSVDGASAPQCVPDSGSCEMTTSSCVDDSWEVNDTPSQALANPPLTPGSYDLVSCPDPGDDFVANDDWFRIVVAGDSQIDLQLAGGDATDLDLYLYDASGGLVAHSAGLTSTEQVSMCVPAGTYYVEVIGFGNTRNPYKLTYTSSAHSCTTACTDDSHEPDSSAAQARTITQPDFTSTGNQICPDNDDWYKVHLFTGDLLVIDLAFSQSTPGQDLDIHLYKDGVDLTPCEVGLDCVGDNGQSGTSNEHAEFLIASPCDAGCDYDVVVHGYNHSANAYDIAIGVE